MLGNDLSGRRVLVIEDEYLIAEDLVRELTKAGAIVIGPAGALDDAMAAISAGAWIDGAIVDANLRGQMVFPAADMLLKHGVPFVFTTGYDAEMFPARFTHIMRCEKPLHMRRVVQALCRALPDTVTIDRRMPSDVQSRTFAM